MSGEGEQAASAASILNWITEWTVEDFVAVLKYIASEDVTQKAVPLLAVVVAVYVIMAIVEKIVDFTTRVWGTVLKYLFFLAVCPLLSLYVSSWCFRDIGACVALRGNIGAAVSDFIATYLLAPFVQAPP